MFFLSVRLCRNNIHKCKDIILQSMILLNRKITRTFLTPSKRLLAPCKILVVTKKKKDTYFRYRDSSPSHSYSLSLYLKNSPYLTSDIDECSKNSHNCSYTTATCTNTNGSFKCICKPGFSGDGHNCTGIEHYLEHDNLSFHHNKTYATGRGRVIVYTNLLLLKT